MSGNVEVRVGVCLGGKEPVCVRVRACVRACGSSSGCERAYVCLLERVCVGCVHVCV